ncbi:alpha/beta hydrolase [Butyrivibrio sp. VCD2006]|uniref:alpha/beta hydrolase n=1 Tax=Butyrivibrio sp. VCD2006 TaxID=1280664 RepID=UPI0004122EE0|nr:alpha/beta hydrolase [Butyrivibrio sp. VCD2006]
MLEKIKKILKWIIIFILIAVVGLFVAFKFYTHNYYRTDISITDNIKELLSNEVHSYSDKNGMVFIPQKEEIKAVIVFYPGGKVEYTSYNGLMYELGARGYLCLVPKMPDNLALLNTSAVNSLTSGYESFFEERGNMDWYLAGHSLGGVAAGLHISSNPIPFNFKNDQSDDNEATSGYKGLILCASYPTTDLSDSDIRLLSIYGSCDKVLDLEKYEDSKKFWPKDSEERIIKGGNHSYFGSYGIQNGDGVPEISNYAQITQTANIIAAWIEEDQQ